MTKQLENKLLEFLGEDFMVFLLGSRASGRLYSGRLASAQRDELGQCGRVCYMPAKVA